jgi:chaperonin GroES
MTKEAIFMIRPLGERVLIETIAKEEKTAFGIVFAVGSGAVKDGVRIALEVKEGDLVLFSKYAGTEVKYEGKEYLIMKESDIHAILS